VHHSIKLKSTAMSRVKSTVFLCGIVLILLAALPIHALAQTPARPNLNNFRVKILPRMPLLTAQDPDSVSSFAILAANRTRNYAQGNISIQTDLNVSSLREFDFLDTVVGGNIQYNTEIKMHPGEKVLLNTIFNSAKQGQPFDFTINTSDLDYRIIESREYDDASLQEISFTPFDGSSRNTSFISFKTSALRMRFLNSAQNGRRLSKLRPAVAANFRLENTTLPCARISSISAIVLTPLAYSNGGVRNQSAAKPPVFAVNDIQVRGNLVDMQPWRDWFYGANRATDKRSFTIIQLAPNMRDEIFRITLTNVEIRSFSEEGTGEQIRRFVVSLRPGDAVVDGK
jgi:hypothetical protein